MFKRSQIERMDEELELYGEYFRANIDILKQNLNRFESFLKDYDALEKQIKSLPLKPSHKTMVLL